MMSKAERTNKCQRNRRINNNAFSKQAKDLIVAAATAVLLGKSVTPQCGCNIASSILQPPQLKVSCSTSGTI